MLPDSRAKLAVIIGAQVSFELGLSSNVVLGLAAKYGTADVVFEDHCKECYARDLVAMEKGGLVVSGTWLIADNVLYPGAPDLLAALSDKERYAAALVPYKYEYDQVGEEDTRNMSERMPQLQRFKGLMVITCAFRLEGLDGRVLHT